MKKIIRIRIASFLIMSTVLLTSFAVYATSIDNGTEVEEHSPLTYYLNVKYDAKNTEGIESSDSLSIQKNSNTINVSDALPDGLAFEGFVSTSDGSIGAKGRADGEDCLGRVVDDTPEDPVSETICDENGNCHYHGLHYDDSNRTVNFAVKSLQAGCEVVVGIKTRTPSIDDPNTPTVETRRDFYNTANAVDDIQSIFSNTVHVFMGKNDLATFSVRYEYDGEVPANAPKLPEAQHYAAGTTINLIADSATVGYIFSGWSSDDVIINNRSFVMPNQDIVLKGSFTEQQKYTVSYNIDGDKPNGYIAPENKQYYSGENVEVDSLKNGDMFNGYRFLGWTTEDATVDTENMFKIADKDVAFTGKFELVQYTIRYHFYDTAKPSDADAIIPADEQHRPGEKVNLPTVSSSEPDHYFLGWYESNPFTMPDHDVDIYGEWGVSYGKFEPSIAIVITNPKDHYKENEEVLFDITVTNNATFAIKDVVIENTDNSTFISHEGYELISNKLVRISEIAPGSTVTIKAKYVAQNDEEETYTNTAKIIGAIADNHYTLVDKDYIASTTFKVKNNGNDDEMPTPPEDNPNPDDSQQTDETPQDEATTPKTVDIIINYVSLFIISSATLTIIIASRRFLKHKK